MHDIPLHFLSIVDKRIIVRIKNILTKKDIRNGFDMSSTEESYHILEICITDADNY